MTEEICTIVARLRAIARQEEPGDTIDVVRLFVQAMPHIRGDERRFRAVHLLSAFELLFLYRDCGLSDAEFELHVRDVLELIDQLEAATRIN